MPPARDQLGTSIGGAILGAFLSIVLGALTGCQASNGGAFSMSDEHMVLGEEVQSFSHSDPDLFRRPLTRSAVMKIVWSPDGRRLASAAFNSDQLILWDVGAGRAIAEIPLGSPRLQKNWSMAFSPDGTTLATCCLSEVAFPGAGESFSVVSVQAESEVRNFAGPLIEGKPAALRVVSVSPSAGRAAMLFEFPTGQTLAFYDPATWRPEQTFFTLVGLRVPQYERDMALSPDGRRVALLKTLYVQRPLKDDTTQTVSGKDYELVLWEAGQAHPSSSTKIYQQGWPSSWPAIVRFSPDGRQVAVGMANDDPRPVRLFDVSNGKETRSYNSPLGEKNWPVWSSLYDLAWSPDGKLIAFCSKDGFVHVLNAASSEVLDSIKAGGTCEALAFSPDGSRLAYGADHTVVIRKILNHF